MKIQKINNGECQQCKKEQFYVLENGKFIKITEDLEFADNCKCEEK